VEKKSQEEAAVLHGQLQPNPYGEIRVQDYWKFNILWREKQVLAQIRNSSHKLRCERGRWEEPKEEQENRACQGCRKGEMGTKQHFLLHCETYIHIKKKAKLHNGS
jgi:hypothetical protein